MNAFVIQTRFMIKLLRVVLFTSASYLKLLLAIVIVNLLVDFGSSNKMKGYNGYIYLQKMVYFYLFYIFNHIKEIL